MGFSGYKYKEKDSQYVQIIHNDTRPLFVLI